EIERLRKRADPVAPAWLARVARPGPQGRAWSDDSKDHRPRDSTRRKTNRSSAGDKRSESTASLARREPPSAVPEPNPSILVHIDVGGSIADADGFSRRTTRGP